MDDIAVPIMYIHSVFRTNVGGRCNFGTGMSITDFCGKPDSDPGEAAAVRRKKVKAADMAVCASSVDAVPVFVCVKICACATAFPRIQVRRLDRIRRRGL